MLNIIRYFVILLQYLLFGALLLSGVSVFAVLVFQLVYLIF